MSRFSSEAKVTVTKATGEQAEQKQDRRSHVEVEHQMMTATTSMALTSLVTTMIPARRVSSSDAGANMMPIASESSTGTAEANGCVTSRTVWGGCRPLG